MSLGGEEAGSVRSPLGVGAIFEVSPWLAVVGEVSPGAWSLGLIDVLAVAPEGVVSLSVELSEDLVAVLQALLAELVLLFDNGGDDQLADDVGKVGEGTSEWTNAAWGSSVSIESSSVLIDFRGDEEVPVDALCHSLLDHLLGLTVHRQVSSLVFYTVELVVVVSLGESSVLINLLLVVFFAEDRESIREEVTGDERSIVGIEKLVSLPLEVSAFGGGERKSASKNLHLFKKTQR